ncbi:DNA polymerase III subunit alpha [Chryseomicrobium palamuruense]|uniref:DNA-directed DNA polymerase n=1 Tax=Chryseomicrobium palamuruense TaxID=682973 RepID=A0ABV8UY64_9BACL
MAVTYPQIRTSMDLLSSTIRLDRLSTFLVEQRVQLAAITNSTLYGVLPFYDAMIAHGIQPVVGLRYFLQFEEERLEVVSYAKTEVGWKNLLKLSSAIETKHVEAVPFSWFQAYSEGLFHTLVVSEETNEQVHTLFSSSIVPAVRKETVIHAKFIETLSKTASFIIPYAPADMESEEDQHAYQVLSALRQGKKLQDVKTVQGQPLLKKEEWGDFSQLGNWHQHFYAQFSSTFSLTSKQPLLPRFSVPPGQSSDTFLEKQAQRGLEAKVPNYDQTYEERLAKELGIIQQMGFSDYFLIVQDFIAYARSQGISVGPGRGSSASSLVAYCLGITNVDPLAYGLLFERFLNPERISLPDIDVDFADYRRDEVIQYVRQKYGQHHVAQILAYGTLSTKAVAREVARVMEYPQEVLAFLSKTIPSQATTLDEVVNTNRDLQSFVKRDERNQLWYSLARRLEGFPRNTTVHAAGVVISPVPIVQVVPIEEHQEGMFLTQWTMKEVETAGLLKMDFLGLRNLSMLDQMTYLIRTHEQSNFTLESLPDEDRATFATLASGDTLGIFQFESPGMRNALQVVEPQTFREVVAVNALFRPGPMAFIPTFAARKKGREQTEYPHPSLEPILKETYGIIVYQEQIMQIARSVGNYSYAEADLLRRAISKKDRNILEKERRQFVDRARSNQFPEETAKVIYDLIVRFAEYGFPKSHATAYSLIAYQMAYIKTHYSASFYAAYLSSTTGNKDKQAHVFREMKRKGVRIESPDLWKSRASFSLEQDRVRIGLSSISGVPRPFVQRLLAIRKQKERPWNSLFELAADLSAKHFTRASLEPLIKAGALDFLGKDRAVLLASLDPAIMHAELVRPTDDVDLFGTDTHSFGEPKYTEQADMPLGYKLQYEKEVLGTYITTHPVELVRNKVNASVETLDRVDHLVGRRVDVIGLIRDIRKIRTKKGQAMAFALLEDERSEIDLTFFPETFASINLHLKEQTIVHMTGKVEQRNGQYQLIVQSMEPI